ncbi:hypothetical protein V2J09_004914 [Rumex salicifolius]
MLIRGFIWGPISKRRRIHMLSWDKIAKLKSEGGLDLRPKRQVNSALLAKLGWQTLQEPTSLWSHVIHGNYCKGRRDVDMFRTSSGASHTWKGIVHGSQLLSKCLRTAVGNGTSTFIWLHEWLDDESLIKSVISTLLTELESCTVAELWTKHGWNWEVLHEYLSAVICQRLSGVNLEGGLEFHDKFYKGPTPSGIYSTKSALQLLRGSTEHHQSYALWKAIWKVQAQQTSPPISLSWFYATSIEFGDTLHPRRNVPVVIKMNPRFICSGIVLSSGKYGIHWSVIISTPNFCR